MLAFRNEAPGQYAIAGMERRRRAGTPGRGAWHYSFVLTALSPDKYSREHGYQASDEEG